MADQAAVGVNVSKAASRATLVKLVVFSASLGIVPIASYFISQKYAWNGNATYAALTAIVAANLILALYIIMSLLEDTSTPAPIRPAPSEEIKKIQ
ncbi:hypothetical protein BD626DRAFT_480359 [Schizophyllum amplum]|uniref:Vacuolar ATPase assembly integral membrane protein VMA21 n=1 Tax=Schizophyllum amplum TaxID=97359 RepID=A0A550CT46_9AGAR|nr:hypothetical protein BD626DRAFT_480359 [Auriculariopsis ampla]